MENILDQVVRTHTQPKRASRPAPVDFKELTKLEAASPSVRRALAEVPSAAETRYPRFDPSAMSLSYYDKKLKLTLPALYAFDLDADSAEKKVTITQRRTRHDAKGYSCPLNWHGAPVWKSFERRLSRINLLHECTTPACAITAFIIGLGLLIHKPDLDAVFPATLGIGALLRVAASLMFSSLLKTEALIFRVTFDGLIPQKTKEKMKAAQKDFVGFLLVCDVTDAWSMEKVPRPFKLDPLVIGVSKDRGYFLVDQFDLTPIEELARAEWTTQPEQS
jgi:hypothetical protein